MNNEIMELMNKIESSKDSKEILHLRGQLIAGLKNAINNTNDVQIKTKLDLMLYDEMKKHKQHIETMQKEAKTEKYPISERLALRLKKISATIELFMKKSDVLGRLKVGAISGGVSALIGTAFSAGLSLIGIGGPFTLAAALPTACYLGLSSMLSTLIDGTQQSQIYKKYDSAPEDTRREMEFCQKYIAENEEFVRAAALETTLEDIDEKIANEEKLIKEYEKIIEAAPTDQIKQVITLEMVDVMKNLEYNYSYKEKEYLNGRYQMSNEEYQRMVNRNGQLKKDIKVYGSFFKDTAKTILKNVGKQSAITYAARIALIPLFPQLAFKEGIADKLTPLIYTLVGNAFSFGDISNRIKMQKTDYTGTIIKMTHPELFEEQRNVQMPALQAA